MRAYLRTTVAQYDAIARDSFTDLHEMSGRRGVFFASRQLDQRDGFGASLTLCLDVPDDVFAEHDVTDSGADYRLALIPAAVLNGIGKPQIYDHFYAECSRAELLRMLRLWEEDQHPIGAPQAQEMREAIEFLDRIGWRTCLKLKEHRFDRATGIKVE